MKIEDGVSSRQFLQIVYLKAYFDPCRNAICKIRPEHIGSNSRHSEKQPAAAILYALCLQAQGED